MVCRRFSFSVTCVTPSIPRPKPLEWGIWAPISSFIGSSPLLWVVLWSADLNCERRFQFIIASAGKKCAICIDPISISFSLYFIFDNGIQSCFSFSKSMLQFLILCILKPSPTFCWICLMHNNVHPIQISPWFLMGRLFCVNSEGIK